MLQKSASPRTKERAETLFGTAAFGEQISRKLSSALKLREEISTKEGNEALEAYSGVEIVTRRSEAWGLKRNGAAARDIRGEWV